MPQPAGDADWQDWRPRADDPLVARAGVTFDRTPSGPIKAPAGKWRVCAYHADFDERPVCFLDVATLDEAQTICADLPAACPDRNVDYAIAFDDEGNVAATRRTA